MAKLKFGTAGIPHSAKKRSSQEGIKRVAELGLGCMELEFVRSVRMTEKTAEKVRTVAKDLGVDLTAHAPYYVNLNSVEQEKIVASKERIVKAAKIGWLAGAESVTFHAAFYHNDEHKKVFQNVKKHLYDIKETLDREGIEIDLRPETTGSPSQFGTVEEIVKLSQEIPGVLPCIDFSHIFTRSLGQKNTYEAFSFYLDYVSKYLGKDALSRMHIHLSGIEYGPKGERQHLKLKDSEINYRAIIQALVDYRVGGWVICESPNLEDDALLLYQTYQEFSASQ
ncbi:MAG: TIM barrel protein [Firmicutes bacterium]|nr:TIM barrel protein [Bacillota bacterium]